MASVYPEIGVWYRDLEGRLLCITAVDDDDQSIEVQYFAGEIEEFDLEVWRQSLMIETAPPKDLSGSFDDLEGDERGDPDKVFCPEEWGGALRMLEKAS
ncbi:MAG: hypothetical protein HY940_00660 [Gammaproteobacteria bacterium]|nr:hypothetical protein [Gammaproteobacteria bacterium]